MVNADGFGFGPGATQGVFDALAGGFISSVSVNANFPEATRVEELARLGGVERLRDFGVPENELAEVAEAAAGRAGNQANPKPATSSEIHSLLQSIY